MKDFVKITSSTEGVIKVKQGDTIELECTAVGSFTPSVDWYKGDIPVTYVRKKKAIFYLIKY